MELASCLADLPEELLYNILPHLPLKSLLAARGVCRSWRHAIEFADIHPIRRSLLEVYLEAISADWFLESRQWPRELLRPFDRQAYLDALLAQYNWLPDDFSMWILEWPPLAAAAWQWPGLPSDDFFGFFTIHRRPGINTLGIIPPILGTVSLTTPVPEDPVSVRAPEPELGPRDWTYIVEKVPGVLLWEDPSDYQVWLVLEGNGYKGKVVLTYEFEEIFTDYGEMDGMFVGDWIAWMRLQHEHLSSVGGYGMSPASLHRSPSRDRVQFMPWIAQSNVAGAQ